jgi:hypothetical protein
METMGRAYTFDKVVSRPATSTGGRGANVSYRVPYFWIKPFPLPQPPFA